jgi:hypothetical protein
MQANKQSDKKCQATTHTVQKAENVLNKSEENPPETPLGEI